MGVQAYMTLAASIVFTTSIITYVHYAQRQLDEQMKSTYQTALEEKAKKEALREENRLFMIQQEKLTEILRQQENEDQKS